MLWCWNSIFLNEKFLRNVICKGHLTEVNHSFNKVRSLQISQKLYLMKGCCTQLYYTEQDCMILNKILIAIVWTDIYDVVFSSFKSKFERKKHIC